MTRGTRGGAGFREGPDLLGQRGLDRGLQRASVCRREGAAAGRRVAVVAVVRCGFRAEDPIAPRADCLLDGDAGVAGGRHACGLPGVRSRAARAAAPGGP